MITEEMIVRKQKEMQATRSYPVGYWEAKVALQFDELDEDLMRANAMLRRCLGIATGSEGGYE